MKTDRIVQTIEKAFLFGHYDSRGGAMLVIASNFIKALEAYAETFGCGFKEAGDEEAYDNLINNCHQDFLRSGSVIVCDELFQDGSGVELNSEYTDDGYSYGSIKEITTHKFSTKPTKSSTETILIFWKKKKPILDRVEDNHGISEYTIKREKLGEDAFGLYMIRA